MKTLRFLAILLAAAPSLAGQTPPRLTYHVEVKDGDATAYHHALEIDRPRTDEIRLSVAAWAPGSYRLMNVAKDIVDVSAVDERGASRNVRKDGELTWIVDGKGAERVTTFWKFQNPGKSVNNRSYLNQTAGLLDGPRNYLYWRDRKDLPAHVHFKLPKEWKVATGLTPTFDPMVFQANDTDWLLDCPVLLGKIETWNFDVGGVPHRIALDNRDKPVEFDPAAFMDGVRRITQTTIDLWGAIPYPHYTYIFSAGGGGGLEHLTSTTIGVSTRALAADPNSHQGVIAHEFFHAWNVKRLRPRALGPFNYDGPVRTKSLWISEGLTNYYTNVILSRAGFVDEAGFLRGYEGIIGGVIANPGYRMTSPEEASWTVWDSPYLSSSVSYYTQGEYLGLLMDLQIRGETQNRKSVDDGMRLLSERFSGKHGFQSEDVVSTIHDATGVDLHDFFLKHVSAAREIEWQKYFRYMGCLGRVVRRPRTAIALEVAQGGEGGVTVKVAEDSSFARLGLRDEDVITSINGESVKTSRELLDALRKLEVGNPIEVGVKRGSETKSLKGAVEAAVDVADIVGRRGGGVLAITRIPDDSELARSGFENGDVVKAVNGTEVASREAYRAAIAKVRDGEVVKIAIERKGAKQVIEHKAAQAVTTTFELRPDPAATPIELEIRRSLILGNAVPAAASRPVRKAG
jgi:predicted metalloprotease with PDZ domain